MSRYVRLIVAYLLLAAPAGAIGPASEVEQVPELLRQAFRAGDLNGQHVSLRARLAVFADTRRAAQCPFSRFRLSR
jgi:hypothetical protein